MDNFTEFGKNGEVWEIEQSLPFALLFLDLFYLDIVCASFQAAINLP